MASRSWTPEQRQRQAELIRSWQPWTQSTGPVSEEGKQRSAGNAYKGGRRAQLRLLAREIRDLLQSYDDALRRVQGVSRDEHQKT